MEKAICARSKTLVRYRALPSRSDQPRVFWTRALYSTHFRGNANGASFCEPPRRAGTRPQFSSSQGDAKTRLEARRRATFLSQMAQEVGTRLWQTPHAE